MNRPRRLAFVLESGTGGGVEHAIPRIATGLSKRGHAVDVLYMHARNAYANSWGPRPADAGGVRMWTLHEMQGSPDDARSPPKLNYPWIRGPLRAPVKALRAAAVRAAGRAIAPLGFVAPHPALLAWVEREKPDVVFGCHPTTNAAVLATCSVAESGTRAVPMLRGQLSSPASGRREDTRKTDGHAGTGGRPHVLAESTAILWRAAPVVISVSGTLGRKAAETTGIQESRVRVVPNPYDFDRISRLAEEEPVDWPDDGLPVLVNVARLQSGKGQDILIRAVAELAARERPVRLLILGDGEQLPEFRQLARDVGVGDLVEFRGWVGNPFPYMRRASAFVMASRADGRPNAVIEALACGCPVVTTAFDGADEVTDGGRLARIVPVEDPSALAEAVAAALLEGRAGEEARTAAVRRMYDPDATLRAYEEAAGDAMAAPGHRAALAATSRALARRIAAWGPRFRKRADWPTSH